MINGDGGIGVAFTYRNFTSSSRYYGLALTGQYRSSQLYNVSRLLLHSGRWCCFFRRLDGTHNRCAWTFAGRP